MSKVPTATREIGAESLASSPGFHPPGFYPYEPAERCTWTNGYALLPPKIFAGAYELQIHVRHTTHYATSAKAESRAA